MKDLNEIPKISNSLKNAMPNIPIPIYKANLESNILYDSEKEYREYKKKIDEFNKNAHDLTLSDLEELILFIDLENKTFTELKNKFPHLNDATLQLYLLNKPKETVSPPLYSVSRYLYQYNTAKLTHLYFELVNPPNNFHAPYTFTEDDKFKLTITGINELNRIKKEKYTLKIAEESLAISKKSSNYGCAAAWLAGITLLITIVSVILSYLNSHHI